MMELYDHNGTTLDYHNLQDRENPGQCHKIEASVTSISILFDESHGELLQSPSTTDDEANTWGELGKLLTEKFNYEIIPHSKEAGSITPEALDKHKILVLAAPTIPLKPSEVEAITEFILEGNSLLITSSYISFRQMYDCDQNKSVNSLLKRFALQFKQLLRYPPDEISNFYPHYISSEVNLAFFRDPAYLEIFDEKPEELNRPPRPIASFPHKEVCLAAVESHGRIVAIADFAPFSDEYLKYGNNQQLALNIFRWLAIENQLDCYNAQISESVPYGKPATFSITLRNPRNQRLEYISCLLEATPGTEILDVQEKKLRSLAPYHETQLEWKIQPSQLGLQKLSLTIDSLKERKFTPLFFDSAAQFNCVPDVEIDLVILNHHGEIPEMVETGKSVEVQAVFRQKADLVQPSMKLHLTSASPHLFVEQIEHSSISNHWRLTAQKIGDCPITLVVGETGQRISRLIKVHSSIQDQIEDLERNTVVPLCEEIHRRVSELEIGLDMEEIKQIPFHLYTPEQYVEKIYEPDVAERLQEVLQVTRSEATENEVLVRLLLRQIAPIYTPRYGCCIPYDPELATELVKRHSYYQDNLTQNFLTLKNYDESYLKQNIAALILHEKYGHGFFFTQTTLGKQLAILFRHGMTQSAEPSKMRFPYPRILYQEYQEVIKTFWDNAMILREGFATWVELVVLPQLSGTIAQAVHRRKSFLFSDSTYREGYEYLQLIQSYFSETLGVQAVKQVVLEVADIDIGVTEEGGKVRFALDADTLKGILNSDFQNGMLPDLRLRQVFRALSNSSTISQSKLQALEYSRGKDSFDNLISGIIRQSLEP